MEHEEYDIAWDVKATDRLKEIYEYIRDNYSEKSAEKIRNELFNSVGILRKHPESGSREPMLRHLPENYRFVLVRKKYKIIYEFTGTEIRILYIHHTSQNPQNILEGIE